MPSKYKYRPIRTERFTIFSHEIRRSKELGGVCRTVFQAWFRLAEDDVPKPICIVTVNENFHNFVDWIHVDEHHRCQGIATEVLSAIETVIPNLSLHPVTDEGDALVESYCKRFPRREC